VSSPRILLAWVLGLLAVAIGIVLWARTSPTFDPYGWLVWGRQTLHGNLNTNAAPSWKPLPYLFTTPLSVFGRLQVSLWMIVAVAGALLGPVFAGRIAWRLTGGSWPAAALAAAGVASLDDIAHYVLSAQSDPLILALCLGAIDAHLCGRRRLTLLAVTLAALGRPEMWPFLGALALWQWRRAPELRGLIALAVAASAGLWFGIPALTARSPCVAATNAMGFAGRPHHDPALETIARFVFLQPPAVLVAGAAGVIVAIARRERVILWLAAGTAGWLVAEIALALHGLPALARYMYEPAGIMAVLAAVAVGRLPAARWGKILSALLGISLLITLGIHARSEAQDLHRQRSRTAQLGRLDLAIARLGGVGRLRKCGKPVTSLGDQTFLAWTLGVNVADVGFKYGKELRRRRPLVLFTPNRGGWRIVLAFPATASCRALPRTSSALTPAGLAQPSPSETSRSGRSG